MADANLLSSLEPANLVKLDDANFGVFVGDTRYFMLPLDWFDTLGEALAGNSGAEKPVYAAGENLGKKFYAQLANTVVKGLNLQSLSQVALPDFLQYYNRMLKTIGLGESALSGESGAIVVTVSQSPFKPGSTGAFLMAGFMAGFFAPLGGGALVAHEEPAAPGQLKFKLVKNG